MRIHKILKVILGVLIACVLMSYIAMRLWNWLMPGLFGLHTLTYLQTLGLLVLSKILFGGFHRHGGGGRGRWKGREWKRRMESRWAGMTPEERERFRSGMRGRGCNWGRRDETPAPEQVAR